MQTEFNNAVQHVPAAQVCEHLVKQMGMRVSADFTVIFMTRSDSMRSCYLWNIDVYEIMVFIKANL